jgi:hypothetical protein
LWYGYVAEVLERKWERDIMKKKRGRGGGDYGRAVFIFGQWNDQSPSMTKVR